ncbi:MAG: serine/threonine-protein kinase [Isosphaeraceae bacterium]|nr:serine/threonine-protein kinase [Isosphaeraceae bacterium]
MAVDCPTTERLASMLADPAGHDFEAIERHIEGCLACQAVLETLTTLTSIAARAGDSPGLTENDGAGFLDRLRLAANVANDPPRGVDGPGDPLPEIPGYEIEAEIGRGGMGVVYKARQIQADRIVALKMVADGGASYLSATDRARFRFEAENLARLRHPNVVQVHEVSEHRGRPYFTMEYVAGGTLAGLSPSLAGRPRDAAALVETLARAVHAAHLCGVLHRDLKPANILIDEGPGGGLLPKVTDFGLAKRVGLENGLTQTGQILGSPSYMAPEQAAGEAPVGVAADIYGLGAILYELLCGRPPFREPTAWETLMKVAHDSPAPPSRYRTGVPRDLEVIGLKCLAKNPGGRYPDADALAEDLRRYLDGRTIVARPAAWPERAWKWAKRRPGATAALAAAALAVVSILGLTWAYNARLSAALTRATLAEREAAAGAREAGRQRNLALQALNDLVYGVQNRLGNDPATRSLKQSLLDSAIVNLRELARGAEGGPPDLSRADAHRRLGELFLQVGRTPEALDQFRQSTALAELLSRATPNDPDVLATLALGQALVGERLTSENRPDEAIPLLIEAGVHAARRAELAPSLEADVGSIQVQGKLVRAYLWKRDAEGAERVSDRMLALARSLLERSGDDLRALEALADSLLLAADVAELAGDSPRALLQEAVATIRRTKTPDPSNRDFRRSIVVPLSNLAALAFGENRFEDAADGFREVLDLLAATVRDDPENVETRLRLIDVHANLASSLRNLGRYEQAAAEYRPAVEQLRKLRDAGKLRGLAVYEVERLPALTAELEFAEAMPQALADREFARSRPPKLAARLLAYRIRREAMQGDQASAAADAEALLNLEASEPTALAALARARIACLPHMTPDLRERCTEAALQALGRAVDLHPAGADALLAESLFDALRERPGFRAIVERAKERRKPSDSSAP